MELLTKKELKSVNGGLTATEIALLFAFASALNISDQTSEEYYAALNAAEGDLAFTTGSIIPVLINGKTLMVQTTEHEIIVVNEQNDSVIVNF